MRINKYLSECGLCSRREADRLIAEGRVTVNGCRAENGMQAEEGDSICVDGRQVCRKREKSYLKFYKPRGIVCTADRRVDNNLADYLNRTERVTYAGRLDRESEGLLLLTDDGDLIDGLMRARNGHEKEYEVETNREITDDFLDKMRRGIYLRELGVKTRPCLAERTGEKRFRIVLTQGLNRQIRRMCRACGFQVRSLKRIRVANLLLDDMRSGECRELTEQELQTLQNIVRGNGNGKEA